MSSNDKDYQRVKKWRENNRERYNELQRRYMRERREKARSMGAFNALPRVRAE